VPLETNKLTSQTIKSLSAGKFSDGEGLWLVKYENGNGKWFLRYTIYGRRREMGLGAFPTVTLKEAREAASKWRLLVRDGKDPISERDKLSASGKLNMSLLQEIALDAYESRKAELREDGKSGRWFSPIRNHILPRLGKMPVSQISQLEIKDTLSPIWHSKAVTARKALNRLNICLRHAAALGLEVDLQATEKAKILLGKQRHKPQNIASIHWKDVPQFYQSLNQGSITELAMKLLILTAVRGKPIRFINLEQINDDVWTIPFDLMKGRLDATEDFRVPLSTQALEIINQAKPFARDGFLFPSKVKGVISDNTLGKFMARLGLKERPHGFRSSFRGWVAEATSTPFEVAETCLAHSVGNKSSQSYQREDFLEQRKSIMNKWGHFLSTGKLN
jgi:integrase